MHMLIRQSGPAASGSSPDIRSSGAAPFRSLGGHDPRLPIAIGPEQAVAHRGWREARERVLTSVRGGRSLVVLLGPAGTGKTLLLLELARALRASGSHVLLLRHGILEDADLIRFKTSATDRRRVVLVDDAHLLDRETLGRLGQLGIGAFVLARDSDPRNTGSADSDGAGATVVRLAPLPADEVGPFLATRLARAGLRPGLLSPDAVTRLAEHSGGVPGPLSELVSAALLVAGIRGAEQVGAGDVDRAAALQGGAELDFGAPSSTAHPADGPGSAAKLPPLAKLSAGSPARHASRSPAFTAAGLVFFGSVAAAATWLLTAREAPTVRTPPASALVQAPAPVQTSAIPHPNARYPSDPGRLDDMASPAPTARDTVASEGSPAAALPKASSSIPAHPQEVAAAPLPSVPTETNPATQAQAVPMPPSPNEPNQAALVPSPPTPSVSPPSEAAQSNTGMPAQAASSSNPTQSAVALPQHPASSLPVPSEPVPGGLRQPSGETSDFVSEAPTASSRSAYRRAQSHAEAGIRRPKADRSVPDAAEAVTASVPLPVSALAPSSDQASPDRPPPSYIGIYTTGADGTRRFRSLP
jgi:hypothetical protein